MGLMLLHILVFLFASAKLAYNQVSYIAYGHDADINNYRFAAKLFLKLTAEDLFLSCGATIVSNNKLVTSSHCFDVSRNPDRFQVKVGGYLHAEGAPYDIKNITIHEKYNNITNEYDIAVLTLNRNIDFTDPSHPSENVNLPEPGDIEVETFKFIGWGLNENMVFSNHLMEIDLPHVSLPACAAYFGEAEMQPTFVCAGFLEGSNHTGAPCGNDSGSPLLYRSSPNDRYTIFGVLSSSLDEACSLPDILNIFINLKNPEINAWLRYNIQQSS